MRPMGAKATRTERCVNSERSEELRRQNSFLPSIFNPGAPERAEPFLGNATTPALAAVGRSGRNAPAKSITRKRICKQGAMRPMGAKATRTERCVNSERSEELRRQNSFLPSIFNPGAPERAEPFLGNATTPALAAVGRSGRNAPAKSITRKRICKREKKGKTTALTGPLGR